MLVVEDDTSLATMLRYNLEREGFRVEEAADGREELTRISENPPDLVLLDWMLPSMSGLEVCRQLRRRTATRGLPPVSRRVLNPGRTVGRIQVRQRPGTDHRRR